MSDVRDSEESRRRKSTKPSLAPRAGWQAATRSGSSGSLAHPVERVWAALTEAGQLGAWLAPGEFEPWPGGRVALRFTESDNVLAGVVTACDPPRLLEYTWQGSDVDRGSVRWELSAEPDGTGLVLTHSVPESARDFLSRALPGWQTHLERLDALLAGNPLPWSRQRWQELHDRYAQTIDLRREPRSAKSHDSTKGTRFAYGRR